MRARPVRHVVPGAHHQRVADDEPPGRRLPRRLQHQGARQVAAGSGEADVVGAEPEAPRAAVEHRGEHAGGVGSRHAHPLHRTARGDEAGRLAVRQERVVRDQRERAPGEVRAERLAPGQRVGRHRRVRRDRIHVIDGGPPIATSPGQLRRSGPPPHARRSGRRRCTRRGTCPRASGSRACRRRRSRPPRRRRRGQAPGRRPRAARGRTGRSQPAQRLAGEDVQLTAMSGPALGSSSRCGLATRISRSPKIAAGALDRGDLGVLREGVADLAGPARRPRAPPARTSTTVPAGQRVHALHELVQRRRDDEVVSLGLERLDRAGGTAPTRLST